VIDLASWPESGEMMSPCKNAEISKSIDVDQTVIFLVMQILHFHLSDIAAGITIPKGLQILQRFNLGFAGLKSGIVPLL
jgi:hypothetical protein